MFKKISNLDDSLLQQRRAELVDFVESSSRVGIKLRLIIKLCRVESWGIQSVYIFSQIFNEKTFSIFLRLCVSFSISLNFAHFLIVICHAFTIVLLALIIGSLNNEIGSIEKMLSS